MKRTLPCLTGLVLLPSFAQAAPSATTLHLQIGMLQKVTCKGRLQVSAVGDERRVQVEALPKQLGCAVILKPLKAGQTNLILETSAESIERRIVIRAVPVPKEPEFKSHAPNVEEKSR
jgi:hypothetical protein